MLLLILADRNVSGTVGQNVRCHQVGIDKQADGGVLAVLAGLILELRHAIEPADARNTVEYPCEFRVLRDLRLVEKNRAIRIDPDGHAGGSNFACRCRQLGRVLPHSNRVHVHHAVDTGHAVLEPNPVFHCAEIISEMQLPGRLNAGKSERPVSGFRHEWFW